MSFAYMPLYTGDYQRKTRHLTPEEHGMYLMLLMHCWDVGGPAPLDERKLCGITNARSGGEIESLRRVLAEFFVRMTDGYYNERLMKEIERWNSVSRKRADAANKRWGARAKLREIKGMTSTPSGMHLHSTSTACGPSPSPSPSPSLTPELQKQLPSPPPKKPGRATAKEDPPTNAVWTAYAEAFRKRYGVDPVRNAQVNGQLANFVARIPQAEAPQVAAFYATHNRRLYVAAKHCVQLLLRDAESLRTEWATGRIVTDEEARRIDREGTVIRDVDPWGSWKGIVAIGSRHGLSEGDYPTAPQFRRAVIAAAETAGELDARQAEALRGRS